MEFLSILNLKRIKDSILVITLENDLYDDQK